MTQQRLILAIGGLERVLSRLEQTKLANPNNDDLATLKSKHNHLKSEASAAIRDIDAILSGKAM